MRTSILPSFIRRALLLLCLCSAFQAKADNENLSVPIPLSGSPLSLRVDLCQQYGFFLNYNIPDGYEGVANIEYHRTTTYSYPGSGSGYGSGAYGSSAQIITWDQNVCADDISARVTYYRYIQTNYGPIYSTTTRVSNHIPIIVKCVGNPGPITGLRNVSCACTNQLRYSIAPVANATSYHWDIPSGWSFVTNQDSTDPYVIVTPSANTTGGAIQVSPRAACGNIRTGPSSINVTRNNDTPALANNVPYSICIPSGSSVVNYNFTPVCGASSYTFSFTPGNNYVPSINTMPTFVNNGSTTYTTTDPTSVQVSYPSGQYDKNLVVTANYPCGNSPSAPYLIRVHNAVPSTPPEFGLVPTRAGDAYSSPEYALRVNNGDEADYVTVDMHSSGYSYRVDMTLDDPFGFTTLATSLRGPTSYTITVQRFNSCGAGLSTTKTIFIPGPSGPGGGGPPEVEEPYRMQPVNPGADGKAAAQQDLLAAYPNPANESLYVSVKPEAVGTKAQLVDNLGRVVREFTMPSTQALQVDTHDLSDGLYRILLPGAKTKGQTIQIKH